MDVPADVLTVFVYHAVDKEGAFLADHIRRCDGEGRFRFLPLVTDEDRRHQDAFLQSHGIAFPDSTGGHPYIVLVYPGERRILIHGDQLDDWLRQLIHVTDPPPAAALAAAFAPATLELLRQGLMAGPAPAPAPAPAASPTPTPTTAAAARTASLASEHRRTHTATAITRTVTAPVAEMEEEEGLMDAEPGLTTIAVVPERQQGGSKTVNVSAILATGDGGHRENSRQMAT